MHKAPGKSGREGISLIELMDMFPSNDVAREWFEARVWPDGAYCPHCGSFNVQDGVKHKSMTHRCRDCPDKPKFSMKIGTVMEATKLGYRTWAIAVYLLITNLKGVSSMKLHRDLKITQKSAWHLMHRLRKSFDASGLEAFIGPVEADETYIGGKEKNKHSNKKLRAGRGAVGKVAVAGVKDRATNRVKAKVVARTDANTLQGFVKAHTVDGSTVYTDEALAYLGMTNRIHESVKHGVGEFVRDIAHTNGMESFWATLKRGYNGTYHHMSEKHLDRYVDEFAGRHNMRNKDTADQMSVLASGMVGKVLRYKDLVAE